MPRDRLPRGPGRRAEAAIASMALVFLAIPAVAVTVSPAPIGLRVLAWCGLAAFGVVYLLSFLRPRLVSGWPIGANRGLWALLALLPGLMAVPAIGWNVASLTPFLIAMFVFHLDLVPGIVVAAVIYTAVVVGAPVSGTLHPANFWGLFIGVTVATVFVVVMAVSTAWEDAAAMARTEVALARERSDVARDVHDILGHSLTVISVKTELAQRLLRTDPDAAEAELGEVRELARTALAEVRATVTELRSSDFPTQLDASREALRAAGVRVLADGDPTAPPAGALFVWALRELTTNVVRHADASVAEISWDAASLRVTDDGVGMHEAESGNGLTGLVERATAVGATVAVSGGDAAGGRRGTTVEVRLP